MLRQIARLSRPVPSAGERAFALAVYGGIEDEHVPAEQAGIEGVACVDDAARALELFCDLWSTTGLAWTLDRCHGLLDFILAMQDADGRFVNFILDWEGAPNRSGRTSIAGGAFWQARGVLALARASRALSDPRIDPALRRGWRHVVDATEVPPDVRVLHMRAALAQLGGDGDADLRRRLEGWAGELVACRRDGMLMNSPYERGRPHLWGHLQEGVLAEWGALAGRDDVVEVARHSAELVFAGAVDGGFDLPRTQPYDVASAIDVLDTLARVTGEDRYEGLARAARAWFDGRNAAGAPIYDRDAGRVADGIDSGRVSSRSGAEANVVAAQALFPDTVTLARSAASGVPA
ncbi:MAG TPA: hypothetical protein VFO60_07250 [Candidatus Dormibacteraeota bacterium]|nr:hypothetical protein [Candidatus Dormibacteraeota bacterium]